MAKNPRQDHKEVYRALQKELDEKLGPQSITADLTEKQEEEARKVREAGEPLYRLYSRLSEEDVRRIATEVVNRVASIYGNKLSPPLRQQLFFALLAFAVGVMQSATWDILKLWVPHFRNLFMAAEPTEDMKEIGDWERAAIAVAPQNMRNFADDNVVALKALRVQTWSELREKIESTELASVLDRAAITDLMEVYEGRLFARHHV